MIFSFFWLIVGLQAKPETVDKVCEVVKKQLSLKAGDEVTAATKFAALGADSLDTVHSLSSVISNFLVIMKQQLETSYHTNDTCGLCVQVEIVMGLEEAFDIEMAEDKAQNIATVEEAAELIEEILKEKA